VPARGAGIVEAGMPADMPLAFIPFFFILHAKYGKKIEHSEQNLPVQTVSLVLI
jgi:hypothetical protein